MHALCISDFLLHYKDRALLYTPFSKMPYTLNTFVATYKCVRSNRANQNSCICLKFLFRLINLWFAYSSRLPTFRFYLFGSKCMSFRKLKKSYVGFERMRCYKSCFAYDVSAKCVWNYSTAANTKTYDCVVANYYCWKIGSRTQVYSNDALSIKRRLNL